MAILSNLLVNGESRLLGKLYTNDIDIGNDLTVVNQVTAKRLYIDTDYNPSNLTTSNSDSAPFAVGKKTGRHIVIDADEIAAKSNATTRASLYLNYGGGTVYLSNGTAIYADNGTLRAATVIAATSLGNTSNYVPNAYITTATITTGNITTANTNNIYNTGNIYNKNGRIETDVIRSNVWDIVSTQNLGGSFIVAPTIMIKDGSTVTITSVSGTTIVGSIKDTTNITSDSFGGHTWSQNSKIKITGKLTSGDNHYVLGTCDGTLTAKMNTTSNTINFSVTCNASTLPPNGTYTITGGTVMMYNVGGSNLVGIELTSYGTDKYTYIDIYNGSNGIKPVARLGKLDNLSTATYGNIKVNGDNLTGYGIYTNNGFFEGKIVSSSGKIGGFNIGTSAIYSTTNALGTTDNNVYIGTEGISLGTTFKVTKGGAITATSGTIGGFSMDAEMLKSGDPGTSGSVFMTKAYHGTTSIGGGYSDSWRIGAGTSFGVTNTGTLYCNDIQASGGKIGGLAIDTTSIHTYNVAVTSNADNSIALSSADFTRTILSTSRAGLRFAIGDKFGVTGDGVLYTNGANITSLDADNITTGTLSADRIGAGAISIGKLDATTQANINDGNLLLDYADLTSSNWKKESSVTVAYDSSVGMYKVTDTAHTSSRYGIYQDFVVSPNTTYTFSVDIKKGSNVAYACVGFVSGSAWSGSFPNTYKVASIDGNTVRQSVTFTTGASDRVGRVYLNIYPTVANQYAYFALPKLILGTSVEAANYITYINATDGIKIHNAGDTTDYLQVNSTAIKMYRNNTQKMYLDDSKLQFTNGSTVLAEYGSTVTIGETGTGKYNTYIDGNAVYMRKATTNLSKFDGDGVYFYDGSTITSQFTKNGAVIGKTSSNHVLLSGTQLQLKNNGTVLADFGSTITLGQTTGQAAVIDSSGMQIYKGGIKVADFGDKVQFYTSTGNEMSSIGTDGLIIKVGGSDTKYSTKLTQGELDFMYDGSKGGYIEHFANQHLYLNYYNTETSARTYIALIDEGVEINKDVIVDADIHCNNIGQIPSPTNKTVNITSTNVDTYVEGATITLAAGGVYIIHAFATFPSNATEAIRRVQLYNKTSGSTLRADSKYGRYYVTGDIMDIFKINGTTDQTYCTRVSAGVAISSVATYIKAIRIA